ncbi:MAG: hypothetical protein NT001_03560 [Candidatus Woesearchaeota archaeon]|nr:hypothetical protein [Candidatus Woesearchaeota archaeon]
MANIVYKYSGLAEYSTVTKKSYALKRAKSIPIHSLLPKSERFIFEMDIIVYRGYKMSEEEKKPAYKAMYKSASDITSAIEADVKPQSLDDFLGRQNCYLNLTDPAKEHTLKMNHGADYIFDGHYDDELRKNLPGAKNKALSKLSKIKTGKDGKIEDREEVMKVISEYIDEAVKHYHNDKSFKIYQSRLKEMEKFKKRPDEIFAMRVNEFKQIAGRHPKRGEVDISELLDGILGKTKEEAEALIKEKNEIYKEAYAGTQLMIAMRKYAKQEDQHEWYAAAIDTAKKQGLEQIDVIADRSFMDHANFVAGITHGDIADKALRAHGFSKKPKEKPKY